MPRAAEAKVYVPERGSAPPFGRERSRARSGGRGDRRPGAAPSRRAASGPPGRRSAPSTSARRSSPATRPARSGESVRKSSSTRPAARNGRDRARAALGEDEPVARGRAAPRRRRPGRARSPSATTALGRRALPARRSAPASVVRTSAPAAKAGWSGSIRPLRRDDRDSRLGRAGRAARRSSANAVGRRREALLGRPDRAGRGGERPRADHEHVAAGAQEARARTGRRRSRRRSACSTPGSDGIATTPSIVETKFAKRRGLVEAERAAVAPRRARSGRSKAGSPGLVEELSQQRCSTRASAVGAASQAKP